MSRHTCKNPSCNCIFEYCRACTFRPVRYKDAGFCSKECYETSKNVVVQVVEPEVIEDTVVVEEPKQIEEIIEEVKPVDEEISMEVETETIVPAETPSVETTVAEFTLKKETNTYKKKKNKYKYTSSY